MNRSASGGVTYFTVTTDIEVVPNYISTKFAKITMNVHKCFV